MFLLNKLSTNVVKQDLNQHIKKQLKKQRGLTLTEVGLAVAISAIIVVAALGIYGAVSKSAKESTLRTELGAAIAAVQLANNNGELGTSNPTPADLGVAAKDPWGGSYTFDTTSSTSSGQWTLTADAIPTDVCNDIGSSSSATSPWARLGVKCTSGGNSAVMTQTL